MSNELTKRQTYDVMEMNDAMYARLKDMAEVMSNSVVTVPKHLVGKPNDCMAIILQARSWGMDPMPVAQKTHLVNGTLGYEAQLVNAVICSSGVLKDRPKYEFKGDWSKVDGRVAWKKEDEEGLSCVVTATLKTGETLSWECYMTSCTTRNSPNWKSKPKLQLSYQAIKEWCRVHTPDVILGVYTTDELVDADIIEVRAEPVGDSRTEQLANALTKTKKEKKEKKMEPEVTTTTTTAPAPVVETVTATVDAKAEDFQYPTAGYTGEAEPEVDPAGEPKFDETDEIPMTTPVERPKKITRTQLMHALAKTGLPDSVVKAFCIANNQITESQTLDDLVENWKRRIVESPESVRQAVEKWQASM